MIKVAICDDDIATTGKIEDMLCRIAKRNFIPIETEVFWEGEHLSEAVESMDNFDVIFLDIEMGQADGITVARKIRETDKNVLIIYVTSHESYMQESFSVRPFRFLVKPVEEKQIAGCLEAAYEEISSADSYFRYSYQRLNCKIPVRDILYFESKRRKVYIVTEKETFEFYGKLNEIEESLRASKGIFLRIHQSFLINYKHIKGLAYDFAVMDNEERLSISEDYPVCNRYNRGWQAETVRRDQYREYRDRFPGRILEEKSRRCGDRISDGSQHPDGDAVPGSGYKPDHGKPVGKCSGRRREGRRPEVHTAKDEI